MTVVLKPKKDHETHTTLTLRTRFECVSRGIQAQGHEVPTDLIFRTWLTGVSHGNQTQENEMPTTLTLRTWLGVFPELSFV